MQSILSLDLSTDPALVQVLEVDLRSVRILESHRFALGELFSRQDLFTAASVEQLAVSSEPGSSSEPDRSQEPPPASVADLSPESMSASTNGAVIDLRFDSMSTKIQELRNLIGSLKNPWANCIVLIPPYDQLSLNLSLPFGDQRRLEKILDLEVQDRVPFDIEEFLAEHCALGQLPDMNYDIHVAIIPKLCIQNVLRRCRQIDLEPLIITTPPSILEALYHLGPEYFSADSAVLLARDPNYYLLVRFEGKSRTDRVIRRANMENPSEGSENEPAAGSQRSVLTEIKLSLAVAEAHYQRTIDKVYVVGNSLSPGELQQFLGRNVEAVSLADLVQSNDHEVEVASLAGIFAQDSLEPPILTNFRAREFVYSPRLRELWEGLKRLTPYLMATATCAIISLFVIFYLQENKIHRMRTALQEQIHSILPGINLEEGDEVNQILTQNSKLEEDLGKLGSPSRFSPLDAFREIALDFQSLAGVSLQSLSIARGNYVKIQGQANGYPEVDKMDKTLRAKLDVVYCRMPQPDISRPRGGKVDFTLKMWMCE